MSVKQCSLCFNIYEDFDSISDSKTDYCNQCFINTVYVDWKCWANYSHYWNILANNGRNNATLPAAEPVEATNSVTLVKVSLAVAFSSGEQPAIDKYSDEITNMINSVKFGEPLIRTWNIEQSTQTTSKSDVAIEPVSVTKEVQDNCDASYPDFCIASPPPNLNCPDIPQKRFTVSGSDPHEFDRDNDGIGCES